MHFCFLLFVVLYAAIEINVRDKQPVQDVGEDEQQESCHDDEEEGEVGGCSYRVAFECAHLCRHLCAYQNGERNVDQDACHQDDETAKETHLEDGAHVTESAFE